MSGPKMWTLQPQVRTRHLPAGDPAVGLVLVVRRPADLQLTADLELEVAVGAREEEAVAPPRGQPVVHEARAHVGVGEHVSDERADLAGAGLGQPVLVRRGLQLGQLAAHLRVVGAQRLELILHLAHLLFERRIRRLCDRTGRQGEARDQADGGSRAHA